MSYNNYLNKLNYTFKVNPLIVGGHALSYYNIRKEGNDLDIVVDKVDWNILRDKYPDKINLFGGQTEDDIDATINLSEYKIDIIKTLWLHNYEELNIDSIKLDKVNIISIPKLLYIKTFPSLRHNDIKSTNDLNLIINKIVNDKYKYN